MRHFQLRTGSCCSLWIADSVNVSVNVSTGWWRIRSFSWTRTTSKKMKQEVAIALTARSNRSMYLQSTGKDKVAKGRRGSLCQRPMKTFLLCLNKTIEFKLDWDLLPGRLDGTSVDWFGPRVLTSLVTLTTIKGHFHPLRWSRTLKLIQQQAEGLISSRWSDSSFMEKPLGKVGSNEKQ